jgi:formylglycine-generating enzyme required for sulfatase activity
MAMIPAAKSKVGTSVENARRLAEAAGLPPYAFRIETPERFVDLPRFNISRYPVTNMEYLQFVKETGRKPPSWWSGTVLGPSFPPWKANHPVWGVGFHATDHTQSECPRYV